MKKFVLFAGLIAVFQTFPVHGVNNPALLAQDTSLEFPYTMVGQILFTSGADEYQGSGTVIKKRSVLTAAHNLWDVDGGWSTDVEFNRGRYGTRILSQQTASRLFIFAGYKSSSLRNGPDADVSFARDTGGMRFSAVLADGGFAKYKPNIPYITGSAYNIAVGYGADLHSGDDPLFVEPAFGFTKTVGAFYEVEDTTFEAGMSGGPVFAEIAPGDLRVVGVIVSGTDDPPTAGIRAIASTGAKFIGTYLKY